VSQATTVVQVVQAVAKASLVQSIRDGVVDFLAGQAKELGQKQVSDLIARLRSDAQLRKQIQQAMERATRRWATDYSDRGLVAAVAENTTFGDLPSVQQAIRTVAQRPFDPLAAETLRGKFDDVLPSSIEPVRIERGVVALLEFLREEFAGVPALQQTQIVAAAIQSTRDTKQIVALLEHVLAGPTPTQETLRGYLTWVIDQHRYLDPRGTRQTVRQVQVLLQDIYVSLTAEAEPALSAADRRLYEHELEALLAREDLRPEEEEDLCENLLARYAQVEESRARVKPVDLTHLVNEHSRLVILGDPGAGKTTLLRYLALRHAQALRAGEREIEGLGATRLPLYLRIATYAEHGGGRSLLDFLPAHMRGEDDSDATLVRLIRDRLAEGTCLVLLDGLDEVVEPDQRVEIAAQIDTFIRTHEKTGNRFVVTSRVAGYRSAPLSGDMAHYHVCDMDADQMRRFLQLWCHAVERFQTPELSPQAQAEKAQAEIDGITRAIEDNPGVRRLATNPLLLRTLALIHRTGARLPQRRIELYRLAADTLIRDWQLARGVPEAALVQEAEATRLLAELAAWLHEEKPAGIAAEGEVRAQLAEVKGRLDGKEADHPDVLNAVDDFLDRIRQYTGLFVERAPRRYGFMHLTFEEYFAARWLVAKPRQAARRIRVRLHRERWQEPILLAIGFYGMEFPDDVDHLIEEAILGQELGGPSPYEHVLHRDLLFAVRCLGDQDVSAGLRQRLVGEFVRCWLDPQQAGKYGPLWRRMAQVAQALRGSAAEIALTGSLIAALQDESEDVRIRAADALSNATLTAEAVSALLAALQDESKDVRIRAADALSNATLTAEAVSALLAALQDESEDVRGSAAYALSNATAQPGVVSALLAALQDASAGVRRMAADALSNATAQPGVVSALLAALQDASTGVRRRAADALSNATLTAEAVSALLAALQDASTDVRHRAASALRHATLTAEAVSALLAALQDASAGVRSRAASALSNATAQPEVVSALLAALQDESEDVRGSAAYALSNATAQPEIVPVLLVALQDESADVRSSAASALRNATLTAEAVSALLAALQDERAGVRNRAADALRNATLTAEAVSVLLAALQDERADVRSRAADALRNATLTAEAVSALLAALQDESAGVRSRAASALRNATAQPEVVSALLAALQDESAAVRLSAAGALRNATAQPEVVSALLAALQDESAGARMRATDALSDAMAQPEVVSALLAALEDESAGVRSMAASALACLTRRPAAVLPSDLPEQFAAALDLPGLDVRSVTGSGRARDELFEALATIAPGPQLD